MARQPFPVDLVGAPPFGELTVIVLAPREQWPLNARGKPRLAWLCKCSCGNLTKPIPTSELQRGQRISCGCASMRSGRSHHPSGVFKRGQCVVCGQEFSYRGQQKYCSHNCRCLVANRRQRARKQQAQLLLLSAELLSRGESDGST